MAELALIMGFTACVALYFMEQLEEEIEVPLWMEHVHGPYYRKKYTLLKGRYW